jgi:DNA repair exonuclease SbcCD ATPase subunit
MIAASAGILLVGWLLFELGRGAGGGSLFEAIKKQNSLANHINDLEKENERLRAQIAEFEQAREIDRRAYAEVDRNMADLQNEVLELKQEVAFYRSVVNSDKSGSGLQIQSFKVRREDGMRYQYRLVLAQLASTNAQVQGEAEVTLSGLSNGSPRDVSLAQLSDPDKRDLRFSLRHFQELQGSLKLPAGFVPLRVHLKVTPRNGPDAPVERTYSWAEASS